MKTVPKITSISQPRATGFFICQACFAIGFIAIAASAALLLIGLLEQAIYHPYIWKNSFLIMCFATFISGTGLFCTAARKMRTLD